MGVRIQQVKKKLTKQRKESHSINKGKDSIVVDKKLKGLIKTIRGFP